MKSLSIVVSAALISLAIFWGNRYEVIRTSSDNTRSVEAVFRIDKLTGQVSRCHIGVDGLTIVGACWNIPENPFELTLATLPGLPDQ